MVAVWLWDAVDDGFGMGWKEEWAVAGWGEGSSCDVRHLTYVSYIDGRLIARPAWTVRSSVGPPFSRRSRRVTRYGAASTHFVWQAV
jgi:hypothetical protein